MDREALMGYPREKSGAGASHRNSNPNLLGQAESVTVQGAGEAFAEIFQFSRIFFAAPETRREALFPGGKRRSILISPARMEPRIV